MDNVTDSVNERFRGASEHARHDRLLVSRFGAADAYPAEEEEARQLVGRCAECARLAADVQILRSQVALLPTPRRDRDFRLTAEQAERLRGSALQRWLRVIAGAGLTPVRPLAGVALSVGLVLVMAGVALPTPAGELAALEDANRQLQEYAGATSAPVFVPGDAPGAGGAPLQEADPRPTAEDLGLDQDLSQAEGTRMLLITAGLIIGSLSLAVLLVIIFARRRTSDPLLR